MESSELAAKMLFSSIIVIALLQSNIFSTLSTEDENVSDGKENERETIRKSHPAIDDEIYEWIAFEVNVKMSVYYDQRWKKKIHRVLNKGIYGFAYINYPVYGCEKDRIVTTDE